MKEKAQKTRSQGRRDIPAGSALSPSQRQVKTLSAGEGRADAATAELRERLGRPAVDRLLPPRPHLELEWAPGPPAKAVQPGVSCWECACARECACASTARVGSRPRQQPCRPAAARLLSTAP